MISSAFCHSLYACRHRRRDWLGSFFSLSLPCRSTRCCCLSFGSFVLSRWLCYNLCFESFFFPRCNDSQYRTAMVDVLLRLCMCRGGGFASSLLRLCLYLVFIYVIIFSTVYTAIKNYFDISLVYYNFCALHVKKECAKKRKTFFRLREKKNRILIGKT